MGKKKVIKSGAPSLADLPRDVRGLIADYVEKTWELTPKGKRWTGCSVSSIARAIKKNKKEWEKKNTAFWRIPLSGHQRGELYYVFDKQQRREALRVKINALDDHAIALKARKDLAYRQGLLIRKCKRAVA